MLIHSKYIPLHRIRPPPIIVGALLYHYLRDFRGQFARTWFDQNGTIREENGWYTLHTVIHPDHKLSCFFILFDIDIVVGDALRIKPALCPATITTPGGDIHLYF